MTGRSYEQIHTEDLRRLGGIAEKDRDKFFGRNARYEVYRNRVMCVALCQGAALHYIDGKNGIKGFDVWTFYYEHPDLPFPWRRHVDVPFGPSHFMNWSGGVDLLGRSLKYPINTDPADALRDFLHRKPTSSSWHLAQKAVVLIESYDRIGEIVWPEGAVRVAKGGTK